MDPTCEQPHTLHKHLSDKVLELESCRRAASVFGALGDPARMRILALLLHAELCVTEIAELMDDNLSAVSQRLKLLRAERIVSHRREGKHVYYSLANEHIAQLISSGLASPDASV